MRKPKAKFPFVPNCRVRCLGKVFPGRYIKRTEELSHAWVQITDPPGVFTVACFDLLSLEEELK